MKLMFSFQNYIDNHVLFFTFLRFTEIYVDELKDVGDLKILVAHYLKDCDVTSPLVDGIVK